MSLLVTGTIGIDSVESPHGKAVDVLGGSALYFAYAASLLGPVRLVGVVGEDFPEEHVDLLKQRPIDLTGLEVRKGSKTFRWQGKYTPDMNDRETLGTQLNVIAEAPPKIPDKFRDSKFVFLANTHPAIQRQFIDELSSPKLVVCDTMDLWINNFRDDLVKTLSCVNGVVLNDAEARMLTGRSHLIAAARSVLELGPDFVIVKKGEHGSILCAGEDVYLVPGFPTLDVRDPTGAGDSFAGGMMAYLAKHDRSDIAAIRKAIAVGTCVASIAIEGFSLDSLTDASGDTVAARMVRLRASTHFDIE